MKIQISEDVKRALDRSGLFVTTPRGLVDVKVKLKYTQFQHSLIIALY